MFDSNQDSNTNIKTTISVQDLVNQSFEKKLSGQWLNKYNKNI